jgi:4-amino-4-deoxy-L-arabinose transferase-like glycosyltransferase
MRFFQRWPHISNVIIGLGLFGLALWLRATDLQHFVTADEHNWIYRSGIFLNAFLQGDWPGTSVWLTPGVTTTWLGSLSLTIYYQVNQAAIDQPFLEWLVSFSRNKIDLEVLAMMRWSMAVLTSAMGVVVYGLAQKLWGRPIALLGTLLLLTEPHLLAVSRIIGHDAPITFFVMGSLLAFFIGKMKIFTLTPSLTRLPSLRGRGAGGEGLFPKESLTRYGWFILSGIFAGLAILSKAPAMILIPFFGLVAAVDLWHRKNLLKSWVTILIVWLAVLWITFIVVWPAAWVSPLNQTWLVINNAFLSSAGLEDADVQPYWSIPDPGIFYYLINGAFKVSPLLMIGAALTAAGLWLKTRRQTLSWRNLLSSELAWLALFALLFGVMMTLGVKRSPRYILPAFPALAFVTAWGWLHGLRRLKAPLVISILGVLAVLLALPYAPYYFTYYNPLLGGGPVAARVVRVGWGEGLDELGRWLNQQPDAPVEQVGARYTATLYPFFSGSIASPISEELDYVAFYIKQSQSGYPAPEILRYFDTQKLLYRIRLDGIDYAHVFKGPAMQPVKTHRAENLPIAFRPHTIYAPIGNQFTVDLLWPDTPSGRRTTGEFDSPNGTTTSNENFTLTPSLARLPSPSGRGVEGEGLFSREANNPYRDDNESENQESKTIVFDSKTLFLGQPVTLTLQTTDGQPVLESKASITELSPGVKVSRHTFNLPNDLARADYRLLLAGSPLGNIKARLMSVPPDFALLSVGMAGQVRLVGVRQQVEDQQIQLDLAWQAWPKASNDYTVFIHLLDDNEQRVTGVDVSPEQGFMHLDRKEVMLTHYTLPLPDNLEPGQYQLLVGLYYFAGDELINVGASVIEPPISFE